MKKVIAIMLGVFLLAGCVCQEVSQKEVADGDYNDANVSFDLPDGWTVTSTNEDIGVSMGFESDVMAEKEAEGWLNYKFIQNDENLDLQTYLSREYGDCVEGFGVDENWDFAPPCKDIILSELDVLDVSGFQAYESAWYGVPESGELAKVVYIVLDGENKAFLMFKAIRTGVTDIQAIEANLRLVLDTLEVK